MQEINLGEKLQTLRKSMGYTQKDFAKFLDIPQPSLSSYENNRNSPTTDVLVNISKKCNISLDWLCGISSNLHTISTLGDISEFLYNLLEINEINIEIEINNSSSNDNKINNDKSYVNLIIYKDDKKYKYNSFLYKIIEKIQENTSDFKSYLISKDIYEIEKSRNHEYYNLPVTKKYLPNLSRNERLKKHIEYMKTLSEEDLKL
ncbi:transcriptional regulator [Tyzzerella sp. An114]|uniref:helix-turn-helix domain-containing protein n=1 Tax=Tyzzerella sp. An114 TaxID=1965545 RepID=UPI000B43DC24|nr:helix-turn-helix transcriptional regulator [Tyzzerella sp. An114]OUQ55784.1 transcriptional regulator [Tyzzerella sp. An114]